jgi:hypothetical protein
MMIREVCERNSRVVIESALWRLLNKLKSTVQSGFFLSFSKVEPSISRIRVRKVKTFVILLVYFLVNHFISLSVFLVCVFGIRIFQDLSSQFQIINPFVFNVYIYIHGRFQATDSLFIFLILCVCVCCTNLRRSCCHMYWRLSVFSGW